MHLPAPSTACDVQDLPPEVFEVILDCLPFSDISSCLTVNTRWASIVLDPPSGLNRFIWSSVAAVISSNNFQLQSTRSLFPLGGNRFHKRARKSTTKEKPLADSPYQVVAGLLRKAVAHWSWNEWTKLLHPPLSEDPVWNVKFARRKASQLQQREMLPLKTPVPPTAEELVWLRQQAKIETDSSLPKHSTISPEDIPETSASVYLGTTWLLDCSYSTTAFGTSETDGSCPQLVCSPVATTAPTTPTGQNIALLGSLLNLHAKPDDLNPAQAQGINKVKRSKVEWQTETDNSAIVNAILTNTSALAHSALAPGLTKRGDACPLHPAVSSAAFQPRGIASQDDESSSSSPHAAFDLPARASSSSSDTDSLLSAWSNGMTSSNLNATPSGSTSNLLSGFMFGTSAGVTPSSPSSGPQKLFDKPLRRSNKTAGHSQALINSNNECEEEQRVQGTIRLSLIRNRLTNLFHLNVGDAVTAEVWLAFDPLYLLSIALMKWRRVINAIVGCRAGFCRAIVQLKQLSEQHSPLAESLVLWQKVMGWMDQIIKWWVRERSIAGKHHYAHTNHQKPGCMATVIERHLDQLAIPPKGFVPLGALDRMSKEVRQWLKGQWQEQQGRDLLPVEHTLLSLAEFVAGICRLLFKWNTLLGVVREVMGLWAECFSLVWQHSLPAC
eukprot:TRINITY_DN57515_c0_g1_i2.p1 TRINITY_DN57515_c0_g1~~TRINITY_DN57515_c0_g1_i2.p1  ORF type:complete len:668 (+),score=38.39 TRINITY_DN57515_c0_g1_i2:59-2062(+)